MSIVVLCASISQCNTGSPIDKGTKDNTNSVKLTLIFSKKISKNYGKESQK